MANQGGRPESNTAEYFRHAVAHKKTVYKLEAKYKNDGYAFLFKLFEQLGSSEGHFLDLSDADNWEYFVLRSGCSEELCEQILKDLVNWRKVDRELWETGRIVWYQKFVDGLKPLYTNRKREVPDKPKAVSTIETTISTIETKPQEVPVVETGAGSVFFKNKPDSIVKYSIVEESKEPPNPLKNSNGVGDNGKASSVNGRKPDGGSRKEKVAQKRKDEPVPFWDPIKKVFDETYEFVKKRPYVWSKPQGNQNNGSLSEIIETLKDEAIRQGKEWTEDVAVEIAKDFFTKSFSHDWLKKNYSLKHIVAKVNEVLAIQNFGIGGTQIVMAYDYLYQQSLEIYIDWYTKKNEVAPIINDWEEEKLRLLIAELRSRSGSDAEYLQGWKNLFAQWCKLEPFLQQRMSIREIYTNINQIIIQIKSNRNANGHSTSKNGFHDQRERFANFSREDAYAAVDSVLGGRKAG